MPATVDRYWTRAEVLALPEDGKRYELVHGELLVSPSPRNPHQRAVGELHYRLRQYLEREPVGEVLMSPADISWGEEDDVLVQPDLFVIAPPDVGAREWIQLRHFHLFIEVLSPSTARYDRFTKRRLYQEKGVPLYWIVDLGARRAEVWTPDATIPIYEASRLVWQAKTATAPFVVDLDHLFERALP